MKKSLALVLALGLAVAGATANPGATQAAAGARSLSLATSASSTTEAGDRVALTGRRDAQVGPVVRLQSKRGGAWSKVATTRADGPSYGFTVVMPARVTTYRVRGTQKDGDRVTSRPVTLSPLGAGAETGGMLAKVQARILGEVNAYRADAGLDPLKQTPGMDAVAVAWSRQMATARQMSHNPRYAEQIPKGWSRAGENVAYGFAYTDVTTGWYDSPGHRANMLGDYTHIGIGWAVDDDGVPYYTQNFGSY